jgi:hypothetical protein
MADPVASQNPTNSQKPVGAFAFRFSGFTMRNNILYHLAGVGQFTLDAEGKLVGSHKSSLSALQGQRAKIEAGNYLLTGNLSVSDDGVTGTAQIHFADQTGRGLNLDGGFYVVVAGSADRLWLVSSSDTIPEALGPVAADEIVSLEAIRMGAA